MKRIILGDPHGHFTTINDIYEGEHPDMVIILGDYCDSFIYDSAGIAASYKGIRKLQKAHEKKHGAGTFVTLLGNHDWHYITFGERYSGFKQMTWNTMHMTLDKDMTSGNLPIVYVDDANKTIYSHAGLTKTWMSEWGVPSPIDANDVNDMGLNFSHMSFDMYGNSKFQGPLWVRPSALLGDFYGDGEWTQIVGHTRTVNGKPIVASINGKEAYDNQEDAVLFVIDTLPFVYIREILDDNGKLVSRELVENVKYNEKDSIQ